MFNRFYHVLNVFLTIRFHLILMMVLCVFEICSHFEPLFSFIRLRINTALSTFLAQYNRGFFQSKASGWVLFWVRWGSYWGPCQMVVAAFLFGALTRCVCCSLDTRHVNLNMAGSGPRRICSKCPGITGSGMTKSSAGEFFRLICWCFFPTKTGA